MERLQVRHLLLLSSELERERREKPNRAGDGAQYLELERRRALGMQK